VHPAFRGATATTVLAALLSQWACASTRPLPAGAGAQGGGPRSYAERPEPPARQGPQPHPEPTPADRPGQPIALREIACRQPGTAPPRAPGLAVLGTVVVLGGLGLTAAGLARTGASCGSDDCLGAGIGGVFAAMIGGAVLLGGVAMVAAGAQRPSYDPRCDAVVTSHCAGLGQGACIQALSTACTGGDHAACWALDPTLPGPPSPEPASPLPASPPRPSLDEVRPPDTRRPPGT
jgi:hypothetical protein